MSTPTRPCPTCHKPAATKGPDAPFCSSRCRMVDLGAWLTGGYRIPVEPDPDDPDLPQPGEKPDPGEENG